MTTFNNYPDLILITQFNLGENHEVSSPFHGLLLRVGIPRIRVYMIKKTLSNLESILETSRLCYRPEIGLAQEESWFKDPLKSGKRPDKS
jgi:hypothetical protein